MVPHRVRDKKSDRMNLIPRALRRSKEPPSTGK
jgi:hypothetical protein